MSSPVTIDDHDPQVQYSGTWVSGGTSHEVDGTVSSSTNVGDSFTLKFSGQQIGVYGTYDSTSGGVVTSYAIDGGTAAQATSPAGAGDTYQQQFWTSPILTPGAHTLVVSMVKVNPNSEFNEGTIWFDYFLVTSNPIFQSSTESPSSTGINSPPPVTVSVTVVVTSPVGSISSATSTDSPPGQSQDPGSGSVSSTDSLAGTQHKTSHAGAIAGGVIGGIVFVLLLFVVAFLIRRRGRRRGMISEKALYRTTSQDGGHT